MSDTIKPYNHILQRVREHHQKAASAALGDNLSDVTEDPAKKSPSAPSFDESKGPLPAETSNLGKAPNTDPKGQIAHGGIDKAPEKKPVDGDAQDKKDTEKAKDPSAKVDSDGSKVAAAARNLLKISGVYADPKSHEQAANNFDINLEDYKKLASFVSELEGGKEQVEKWANEKLGQEKAEEIIKAASNLKAQYEGLKKAAAEHAEVEEYARAIEETIKSASAEEQELFVKYATIHGETLKSASAEEKVAYNIGVMDASRMVDSMAGSQTMDQAIKSASIPGVPAEGEEPSPEDILELVAMLVQMGELDEETALQIQDAILAEVQGGGVPAEGGEPSPEELAMLEEAMAAEGAPEEAKMASSIASVSGKALAKFASTLYK